MMILIPTTIEVFKLFFFTLKHRTYSVRFCFFFSRLNFMFFPYISFVCWIPLENENKEEPYLNLCKSITSGKQNNSFSFHHSFIQRLFVQNWNSKNVNSKHGRSKTNFLQLLITWFWNFWNFNFFLNSVLFWLITLFIFRDNNTDPWWTENM